MTECYEHAKLLESVAGDLRGLCEEVARQAPDADGRAELEKAEAQLGEAVSTLQRGADVVV